MPNDCQLIEFLHLVCNLIKFIWKILKVDLWIYHDSRMRQGLAKDDIFALKLSIEPNNHSFLRPKFLSVADDSFHQCSLSIQKFDHLVCYKVMWFESIFAMYNLLWSSSKKSSTSAIETIFWISCTFLNNHEYLLHPPLDHLGLLTLNS